MTREVCEKFLEAVSRGDLEAVVTGFSIHAAEAIPSDSNLILRFLRNIQNSLGLNVYETSIEDEVVVTMLIDKLDFDDSLQYYIAKNLDLGNS
ncbi:MAG: hypothetical protein ACUVQ0_06360 [Thermoproteota archaeon]